MLTPITFTGQDRINLSALDQGLQNSRLGDPWVQEIFINAYRDVFDEIKTVKPALAVPYNCGTILATESGTLVGVDLALPENYYGNQDWEIPGWLYDLIVDRLDLLIITHGHWDHYWKELVDYMIFKNKPVIVPAGINAYRDKPLAAGCRGVVDGEQFWWKDLFFSFCFSRHAYDNGRDIKLLTTRVWNGRQNILHTSDADTTTLDGFRWDSRFPIDILLFKVGGVSPLVQDYDEMATTIDRINPRHYILPMHLNELGHRGEDGCRTYSQAYEWLDQYVRSGKLGSRRFAVLFGNRVLKL